MIDTSLATQIGNAQIAWSDAVDDPGTTNENLDHNFLEVSFQISEAQKNAMYGSGFSIHWTMECGNDMGRLFQFAIPHDHDNPIPEPMTWILMVISISLWGFYRKRK